MIPTGPQARDDGATRGRHHGVPPELLACVDVRHVYLDGRQAARLDGVPQRVAVMRQRPGVDDVGLADQPVIGDVRVAVEDVVVVVESFKFAE